MKAQSEICIAAARRTSSLLGVGESLSIELYDDDELLLARSELIRRAVGGPRDDDKSTDWNSSQSRLKRRDGPTRNKPHASPCAIIESTISMHF